MREVALRFPGDLRNEEQRERRQNSARMRPGDDSRAGISESVGAKEERILQHREAEDRGAEEFEDDDLQPRVQRRLRPITPLPGLGKDELLALIQVRDG